jgi:hypothetical protein
VGDGGVGIVAGSIRCCCVVSFVLFEGMELWTDTYMRSDSSRVIEDCLEPIVLIWRLRGLRWL